MTPRRRWWWPALIGVAVSSCGGGSDNSESSSTVATSATTVTAAAATSSATTGATTSVPPTTSRPTTSAATTSTSTTAAATTTTTPALLDLEIVEWNEYAYGNPADPSNKDTHVEMLVRNPNDVPVRVDHDDIEVRFVNGAGEVIYANPNPTLVMWEGEWVRGGETFPVAACVCLETSGLPRQEWETVELSASLEEADDIAYTEDVTFDVGEWFNLQDRHLGGDMLAAEFDLVNTSDENLSSIDIRVIARDANGRYVGVAAWGSAADNSVATIEPGASSHGIVPTMIDFYDGPMTYESEALGIIQG